jgi:hypothetical protein
MAQAETQEMRLIVMDKTEHALFQERMRALVRKNLLEWLAKFFRDDLSSRPERERSRLLLEIRNKLDTARVDYASLALTGMTPEMSDLKSAEFQEAFDGLSKELEKILASPGLNSPELNK